MSDEEQMLNEISQLKQRIQNNRKGAADVSLRQLTAKTPKLDRIQLRCRRTLRGHLAKIYDCHFHENSRNLVSASQDGKMLVWDGYTGNKINVIPLQSTWVMTCSYAPSGNFVASGGLDNTCTIYNLNSMNGNVQIKKELHGHTGFLTDCPFLDDRNIVTAAGDHLAILWDVDTGQQLRQFSGHTQDIMSLTLSPAGSEASKNCFATGSVDNTVKLWDLRAQENYGCKQTFADAEGDVNTVRFHPSGQAIVCGSEDGSCRMFDIRADQEVAVYRYDDIIKSVVSVGLSQSGRLLFAGMDDGIIMIYDVLKQESLGSLGGHEKRVSGLSVSSCGQAMVTCSWDAFLKIWN